MKREIPILVTEAIGTFFLVLLIGLTVTLEAVYAAFGIAFGLTALIYMGGHVSKAQYNPAVSVAFWMRGTFSLKQIGGYIAAQLAGGIQGALASAVLTGKTLAVSPGPDYTVVQMLLAEFLFTFALVLVILNVAISSDHPGNGFYGIAIGFLVFAGIVAVGPVSGAAFNPAVAVSLNLVNGSLEQIPLYLLGTFAGGAAAAWVFGVMNPHEARSH